ncbi:MAG TPA: glycosyl hydrolase family 25, partial [Prevotellaceae bacterium]|nr:glycosyl hydrolase family 25 [Prevotellaceae bacterium]
TDMGRVRGIKGHVDLDIYNGSMYDLQKFTIGRKEDSENEFF